MGLVANRQQLQAYEPRVVRQTVACFGKARFESAVLAKAAAKRRTGRSAYHCPYCRGWHVGTTNGGRSSMRHQLQQQRMADDEE